jgi:hypothetical protein
MEEFSKKKWILKNFTGFAIAYSLYSLIGHGFTGSHGGELTPSQIVSHTIALCVVGLIIGYFQYNYLKKFYQIKALKIITVPIFFILSFWTGWFTLGPPMDIILGFPVLGCVLWVFNPRINKLDLKFKILAFSSFLIAAISSLAIGVFIASLIGIIGEEQNLIEHLIGWLMIGILASIIGGYLSSIPIKKSLNPEPNTSYNDHSV